MKCYRVILTRDGKDKDLYSMPLTEEELEFAAIPVVLRPGDVIRVVECDPRWSKPC